jgi:hypothetical protein
MKSNTISKALMVAIAALMFAGCNTKHTQEESNTTHTQNPAAQTTGETDNGGSTTSEDKTSTHSGTTSSDGSSVSGTEDTTDSNNNSTTGNSHDDTKNGTTTDTNDNTITSVDDNNINDSNNSTTGNSDNNTTNGNDANTTTPSTPVLAKLTLTAPQTHFLRKKDRFYNDYIPIKIPLRVVATYQNGYTEEITDKVAWNIIKGKLVKEIDFIKNKHLTNMIKEEFHTLYATKGSYEIAARYKGVQSNILHIEVEDDKKILQYETEYYKDTITIEFLLDKKPTSKVTLPLTLSQEDNASFVAKYGLLAHTYNVVFEPYMWSEGSLLYPPYVKIKLDDADKEGNITIRTGKLQSSDASYNNIKPNNITIPRLQEPRLDPPPVEQRRGAVRGVQIAFELTQGDREHQTISLVNPPTGMKIKKWIHSNGVPPYGVIVQWDVPMDAIEGKVYHITAKATDSKGREKTITFPIKVPKTTPIQTIIKNNELIVTDPNSPLKGMKLKVHEGAKGDISKVRLRSVAYEDVWRHYDKRLDASKSVEHVVFVIYNKPPKLDIDLPNKLKNNLYRFAGSDSVIIGSYFWKSIAPSYLIDAKDAWDSATGRYIIKKNIKGILQHNEHDDGGNKIYLLLKEAK